jgi:hypothetical protein
MDGTPEASWQNDLQSRLSADRSSRQLPLLGYSTDLRAVHPILILRSSNHAARRIPWMRAAALLVILMILIPSSSTPVSAQCAMCQGSSGAGADGGASYNRSTLFMLCVPYILLGGVAGYIVYAFRHNRPKIDTPRTQPSMSDVPASTEHEPA